jgi:hypothetical protein
MKMKTKWKPHEIELLKQHYSDKTIKELCEILKRSERSIYSQANVLGLKKSDGHIKKLLELEAERLRSFGNQFRFQKGQKPWNKDVKGYMGANVTSFKKGNKPHNIKQVGDTRIDGKDKFLLVKVADRQWIRKEILIWESIHGKVPKGYVVRVKNPALNKYDINNLMLISWAENLKLNTIHRYPKDLQQTIRALKKLKKAIKKYGTKQN